MASMRIAGVAVLVALLFSGCGGSDAPRGAGTVTLTVSMAAVSPPTVADDVFDAPVDAAARKDALRVAAADPIVAAVVGGATYELAEATRWAQTDGPDLGAYLVLKLSRPVVVDADLPTAEIFPEGPATDRCQRPYRQTWRHLRVRNVTQVSVMVDLRRQRVADIDAGGPAADAFQVSRVPGKPFPDCSAE